MDLYNVLTYSKIEQKRNGIIGAGEYLKYFLLLYPGIPILIALFSCYAIYLSEEKYYQTFMAASIIYVIILAIILTYNFKRMFTVYIIDKEGGLYLVYLSVLWRRFKEEISTINLTGIPSIPLFKMFYILSNIKYILDNIENGIDCNELTTLGKMKQITNIREVRDSKRKITFYCVLKNGNKSYTKKIKIPKIYFKIDNLLEFIVDSEKNKTSIGCFERKLDPEKYLIKERNPFGRIIKFSIIWLSIVLWLSLFTINSDLNRLSKINKGIYVKCQGEILEQTETNNKSEKTLLIKTSPMEKTISVDSDRYSDNTSVYVSKENDSYFFENEFGTMFKPMIVLFFSVLFIYIIWVITGAIFEKK